MVTPLPRKLRFSSEKYEHRSTLSLMTIGIAVAWTLFSAISIPSAASLHHLALIAVLILFVFCSFIVYSAFLTYDWVLERKKRYELFIDNDSVSLSTYDQKERSSTHQKICLSEVESVEYCDLTDSSSLQLKSKFSSLEIPLWSFTPQEQKTIMDYISSRGVPIARGADAAAKAA